MKADDRARAHRQAGDASMMTSEGSLPRSSSPLSKANDYSLADTIAR